LKFEVINLNETIELSRKLANCCAKYSPAFVIYLIGDLGAGKTTLAQNFIKYFGFERVKSPTFSLIESYQNEKITIHHFDCYRLNDPEELEYIGLRDYLLEENIQLYEWPDLGKGMIPNPDISIIIVGKEEKRNITIAAHSEKGIQLYQCVTS